jgi:hypothetical protein
MGAEKTLAEKVETKINPKAVILDYLEKSYSGAKMMDDVERTTL